MRHLTLFALLMLALAACVENIPAQSGASSGSGSAAPEGPARILVMGDSMLAWNRGSGASVARSLSARLGRGVEDRSLLGAKYFYGLPISGAAGMRIDAQFQGGKRDWVVMNGGGNDIQFGCGCEMRACAPLLDRLISADGRQGTIPALVGRIRATGAKVVYAGYMRTPGVTSPVEACGPVGDILDARLAKMAARDSGVHFLPMADLVKTDGDTSFHSMDLVHPSPKGSAAIAARLAAVIGR